MKSMANGILLKSKTVTPIECLHYALNLPTSVVITGIDSMESLSRHSQRLNRFIRSATTSAKHCLRKRVRRRRTVASNRLRRHQFLMAPQRIRNG